MNSTLVRAMLVRGMLAGLVAGLLAFGFAYFIGEPEVNGAIAYEAAHTSEHGEELVSRAMQSTTGLATGVLIFGVAVGGIGALVFTVLLGRIGRFSPRATAALVSLAAFITVFLVPLLKYPVNPPAVGNPDTLSKRTTLYFLMIALSVLLAVGAVLLGRRLAPRWGNWNATIAAGVAFVVLVAVAIAFLPTISEVQKDFPATLLWRFRLAAIGVQAVLWASFGLFFGYLAERVLAPRTSAASGAVPGGAAVPA